LYVRATKNGVEKTGMNPKEENVRTWEKRPLRNVIRVYQTSPTIRNLRRSELFQFFATVVNRGNPATCYKNEKVLVVASKKTAEPLGKDAAEDLEN
jgi:hypothetical protein